MEYTKQEFKDGQVLKAEQLNNMENGIVNIIETINIMNSEGSSDSPIIYIESLDTSNLVNLRDLESGTYVLKGYFHPFNGSTASITFSSALLVNIITKTAGTHVQVFYPVNNCVQFLSITDDSYERTNVYLNDLVSNTLPTVTTANNGAFMQVVEGAWAAVNLTDVSTEGA